MNWLRRLLGRFVGVDSVVSSSDVSVEFDELDFGVGVGFGLFEGSALHSEPGRRSVDESVLDWLDEVDDRRVRR